MHSLLITESVFLHKKTTNRVAATLFFNMSYLLFQYHANLYGSQTTQEAYTMKSMFQYHANLYGSQTKSRKNLQPTLFQYHQTWSSTLAVFPQILAEPLDVLAKRWSLN